MKLNLIIATFALSLLVVAQSVAQDAKPTPIILESKLWGNWKLVETSLPGELTSVIEFHSTGYAELASTSASLPVKDASRMASALESAVNAILNETKMPEGAQFGNVTVSTAVVEGRKVVTLTGGETGMFYKKFELKLPLEDATKLAKSMRTADMIHARVMSSVDFNGLWKDR